jgi:hypothetical protein
VTPVHLGALPCPYLPGRHERKVLRICRDKAGDLNDL